MFLAGNRTGKTTAGSMEGSYHLTGRYPADWTGRRFSHPISMWAASDTTQSTRDALQYAYLGDINILDASASIVLTEGSQPQSPFGCGSIPKDCIINYTKARNVVDAVDTVRVRHVSGGESILGFKSYDQGRQKFQGTAKHVIHLDEEPPVEILSECKMRIAGTGVNGLLFLTMTPLLGMSDVCLAFLDDTRDTSTYVQASWSDAPHLSDKDKLELLSQMLPHEIEAREKGVPALGSGKVYPVEEEQILCAPFPIPQHFKQMYGLDFGWNATAACFFAYDSEADVLYLTDEYKQGQREPSAHASTLKYKGAKWMPGLCDPAGGGSAQADGKKLIEMYEEESLRLTVADNAVDAGIMAMLERMRSGRLKVFNTCGMWVTEFRRYARDENGKIIKKNDHLLDAARYAVMSGIPLAIQKPYEKRDLYDVNAPRKITSPWGV